jgi:hypothetical protein
MAEFRAATSIEESRFGKTTKLFRSKQATCASMSSNAGVKLSADSVVANSLLLNRDGAPYIARQSSPFLLKSDANKNSRRQEEFATTAAKVDAIAWLSEVTLNAYSGEARR